jgi:hypothetical protein
MMIRPRWVARFWAWFAGYFWLPCPICHEPFAGFEWGTESLMTSTSGGIGVCSKPECQDEARRRSDEMYASHGMRIIRAHQ